MTRPRAPRPRRRFRAAPFRAAALLLAVWAVIALTLQVTRPAPRGPSRDTRAESPRGGSRS